LFSWCRIIKLGVAGAWSFDEGSGKKVIDSVAGNETLIIGFKEAFTMKGDII
jgi:hypothetical protein